VFGKPQRLARLRWTMAAVPLSVAVPSVAHAATVPDSPQCSKPAKPGRTPVTVTFGGRERTLRGREQGVRHGVLRRCADDLGAGLFAVEPAPVAGVRAGAPDEDGHPDPTSCHPASPVPVVAFHGSADRTNPYNNGGQRYWRDAAVGRAGRVRRPPHGKQGLRAREPDHLSGLSEPGQGAAVLDQGGGHTWPGSTAKFGKSLGATTHEISANELLWKFFAAHRR
jgi:hypothetical protein